MKPSATSCVCCYPFHQKINFQNACAAVIVSALAAIGIAGGVLAIFNASGIRYGMLGGGILSGVSGAILLSTLIWALISVKNSLKNPKTSNDSLTTKNPKNPRDRYSQICLFFDNPAFEKVAGTSRFLYMAKTYTLHYSQEAKYNDVVYKLASDTRLAKISLLFKGKLIDGKRYPQKPWQDICRELNISSDNELTILPL